MRASMHWVNEWGNLRSALSDQCRTRDYGASEIEAVPIGAGTLNPPNVLAFTCGPYDTTATQHGEAIKPAATRPSKKSSRSEGFILARQVQCPSYAALHFNIVSVSSDQYQPQHRR